MLFYSYFKTLVGKEVTEVSTVNLLKQIGQSLLTCLYDFVSGHGRTQKRLGHSRDLTLCRPVFEYQAAQHTGGK